MVTSCDHRTIADSSGGKDDCLLEKSPEDPFRNLSAGSLYALVMRQNDEKSLRCFREPGQRKLPKTFFLVLEKRVDFMHREGLSISISGIWARLSVEVRSPKRRWILGEWRF